MISLDSGRPAKETGAKRRAVAEVSKVSKEPKVSKVTKVRSDIDPALYPTTDAADASMAVDLWRKAMEAHSQTRLLFGKWVIKQYKGIWPFIGVGWEGDWPDTFEPVSNMDFPKTAVKRSFQRMKRLKLWYDPIWELYLEGFKEVFGCPACKNKGINC